MPSITIALINFLLADTALRALAPDGVFKDVASASMLTGGAATRFVIVSFVAGSARRVFGSRGVLRGLYLVEARMLSKSHGDLAGAAARIDALLDPQPPAAPATFAIPGYTLIASALDEPTEHTEFDEADSSIHWNRGGGRYALWTAPVAA